MNHYNDFDEIAKFSFKIKDLKQSLENNNINPCDDNIKKFLSNFNQSLYEKEINQFFFLTMDDFIFFMRKENKI